MGDEILKITDIFELVQLAFEVRNISLLVAFGGIEIASSHGLGSCGDDHSLIFTGDFP